MRKRLRADDCAGGYGRPRCRRPPGRRWAGEPFLGGRRSDQVLAAARLRLALDEAIRRSTRRQGPSGEWKIRFALLTGSNAV